MTRPKPRRVAVTSPQTRRALAGRRTGHPGAQPPLSTATLERARMVHRRQLRLASTVLAALAGLALMPFWVMASGVVAITATAFAMQFLVQCMFGVMPAHLNEISPPEARATFPGFTYQFGNMLAAGNATIQAVLAGQGGYSYGVALAAVAGAGALVFCLLAWFGVEARNVVMDGTEGDVVHEHSRAAPPGVAASRA